MAGRKKTDAAHKKPRKAQGPTSGEIALEDIESLTLNMESGKKLTFDIAAEVAIESGPLDVLQSQLAGAAARCAFWGYQVERQRHQWEKERRRLSEVEANADLVYRKAIPDGSDFVLTERTIRSHVDLDKKVRSARIRVIEARRLLGILERVSGAVEHRVFVLGRLVAQEGRSSQE